MAGWPLALVFHLNLSSRERQPSGGRLRRTSRTLTAGSVVHTSAVTLWWHQQLQLLQRTRLQTVTARRSGTSQMAAV